MNLTKRVGAGFANAVAAAVLLASAGMAQAALVKTGGVVNDTDAHLTWAADMNINGAMSWYGAVAWIASLNSSNYEGYNDWRLPTTNTGPSSNCDHNFNPGSPYAVQYDGYGCTGSEMGNLFINLLGEQQGTAVTDQTGDTQQQKDNFALFSNVQAVWYWSGTEYAPFTADTWFFSTDVGFQGDIQKSGGGKNPPTYALAVRSGDVVPTCHDVTGAEIPCPPPTNIPEPATLSLVALAFAGMRTARRRKAD
jgi:hypothetical protein